MSAVSPSASPLTSAASSPVPTPRPCEFAPIEPATTIIVTLGTFVPPKVGGTQEEAYPPHFLISSLRSAAASPTFITTSSSSASPTPEGSSANTPASASFRNPSPATGMPDPASIPEMSPMQLADMLDKKGFKASGSSIAELEFHFLHHQILHERYLVELVTKASEEPDISFEQACLLFTQFNAYLPEMQRIGLETASFSAIIKKAMQELYVDRVENLIAKAKRVPTFDQACLLFTRIDAYLAEMKGKGLETDPLVDSKQKVTLLGILKNSKQEVYDKQASVLIDAIQRAPTFNQAVACYDQLDEFVMEMGRIGLENQKYGDALKLLAQRFYNKQARILITNTREASTFEKGVECYNQFNRFLFEMNAVRMDTQKFVNMLTPLAQELYDRQIRALIDVIARSTQSFDKALSCCESLRLLLIQMEELGLDTRNPSANYTAIIQKIYKDRALAIIQAMTIAKTFHEVSVLLTQLGHHLDVMKRLELDLHPFIVLVSPSQFNESIFLNQQDPDMVERIKVAILSKLA